MKSLRTLLLTLALAALGFPSAAETASRALPSATTRCAPTKPMAAEPTVVLTVSPNGESRGHFATLECAIIAGADLSNGNTKKIVIQVAQGTYKGERIRFRPRLDFPEIVISGVGTKRPVFDGQSNGTWFIIIAAYGRRTPITLEGLDIRNYQTAIVLHGKREDVSGWNGGVRILENVFQNIGTLHADQKPSTAAIDLINSRYDSIEDNQFSNIRNVKNCSVLHAIYMAHMSSGNTIRKNRFDGGCGSVIRVRDRSDKNLIEDNIFSDQQGRALFEEWFCDANVRTDCTARHQECPSKGNSFFRNRYAGHLLDWAPPQIRLYRGGPVRGCLGYQ